MGKSVVNKKLLNSALQGFVDRLEKTEKFALDQAPDLCKQMVKEAEMQCYAALGGAGLLMLASIAAMLIANHQGLTEPYRYSDSGTHASDWSALFGLGIAGALGAIGWSVGIAYELAYLKNCTKLFLLRSFRRLV